MATKNIKVKLIRENSKMPESKNGNWFDVFTSGATILPGWTIRGEFSFDRTPQHTKGIIRYNAGDVIILHLGIAVDMGKGYEGHILPRSSTFKNTGLLLTNSMGLVDDSYCGDNDEWLAVMYATRAGAIKIGDRHCQIQVEKSSTVQMTQVEMLGNPDRGGYGTSGK